MKRYIHFPAGAAVRCLSQMTAPDGMENPLAGDTPASVRKRENLTAHMRRMPEWVFVRTHCSADSFGVTGIPIVSADVLRERIVPEAREVAQRNAEMCPVSREIWRTMTILGVSDSAVCLALVPFVASPGGVEPKRADWEDPIASGIARAALTYYKKTARIVAVGNSTASALTRMGFKNHFVLVPPKRGGVRIIDQIFAFAAGEASQMTATSL